MSDLSLYSADPARHQQLVPWTPTSYADCSPTTGSWLADEDSGGAVMLTGRQVRLASNEAHPDPGSPGLNWPQVDAAVYKASNGRTNLKLGSGGAYPTVSLAYAQAEVNAGRSIGWQLNRGRLIHRIPSVGVVDGFTGLHAAGLKLHPFSDLRYYDPLIRIYIPITWADVAYAAIDANAVAGTGRINVLATRDVVPSSYHVDIDGPTRFTVYRTDTTGHIADIRGVSVGNDYTRTVARRTQLWWPKVDAHGKPSATGSYRNVALLLNGALAGTPFHWINLDSPGVRYREILP